MIDFRYHLVSIVSIFLALAVGIVLGSGPLKETLSTQLTDEVTSLRASKAKLNTELAAATKGNEARDAFAEAVSVPLLTGRLTGRTVSLLVLPGADASLIRRTTVSLATAGAKLGSTVTLTDAWADPARQAFRTTLATQLADASHVTVPAAAELLAGDVLAKGILVSRTTSSGKSQRPDSFATQALDGLKAGGLLTYSPAPVTLASGVVIVGAPPPSTTDPTLAARMATYVDTARALDDAGSGTVVVEQSGADPTAPEGLVSAVRGDADSASVVASVDDGNLPMGQVATVLALREQYAGRSGAYGLANDATAPVPDITTK